MQFPQAKYIAAIERERLIRDAAFLPVCEFIAGFKVVPMTLRHYIALRVVRNPILLWLPDVRIEHLAQFIWTVSHEYSPSKKAQLDWFRASGLIEPRRPILSTKLLIAKWHIKLARCAEIQSQALNDARRYVDETMQDAPPRRVGKSVSKSFYSEACFWCAIMGREFGASVESVMEMPLKQLFQFLNEVKDYNGKQVALRNPSDDVVAEWQSEQQKRN